MQVKYFIYLVNKTIFVAFEVQNNLKSFQVYHFSTILNGICE